MKYNCSSQLSRKLLTESVQYAMWASTHVSIGLKMSGTYWSHKGSPNSLDRHLPTCLRHFIGVSNWFVYVPAGHGDPRAGVCFGNQPKYIPVKLLSNGKWTNWICISIAFPMISWIFLCHMNTGGYAMHLAVGLADHIPATLNPPHHNKQEKWRHHLLVSSKYV